MTADRDVDVIENVRESIPVVAIVGRPNVGKSTLFNRLIGERRAVTSDRAGTTRDRLYSRATWNGRTFLLVDTGGLITNPESQIEAGVRLQALEATAEADVILFLVDGRDEPLPEDYEVASLLRPLGARSILVANKVDGDREEITALSATRLGLDTPFPVSAQHGRGVGDLLDALTEQLPPLEPAEESAGIRIAVVGRPNVGKSSLVNAFIGRPQILVTDAPGTTRDAIDTRIESGGTTFVLVDTAGLRRRSHVDDTVEWLSTLRTLKVLQSCDVALVLFDATRPPEKQDLRIVGMAESLGRGLVLLANKWDLTDGDDSGARDRMRHRMPFVPWAPLRFISALTGEGLGEVLPLAEKVHGECERRIPTNELVDALRQIWTKHPAPGLSNSGLFGSQIGVHPPTFALFLRKPADVPKHYVRYIENSLRERYGFRGAPIRLRLKKKKEKKRDVSRDHWAK